MRFLHEAVEKLLPLTRDLAKGRVPEEKVGEAFREQVELSLAVVRWAEGEGAADVRAMPGPKREAVRAFCDNTKELARLLKIKRH